MNTTSPGSADPTPVDGFARCHAGIVAQLGQLDRLPALAEAAAQARAIAAATDAFFLDVVLQHHVEEEQELFPAVLRSSARGEEHDRVASLVRSLTAEHRRIEAAWREIEPALHDLARGRAARLDAARVAAFVGAYRAHAEAEETVFLPLAATILGRDGNHMAALGLSLHARHAMPEVLRRFGTHL